MTPWWVCVPILLITKSLGAGPAGSHSAPWGGQDPSSSPSPALGEGVSPSAACEYIFLLTGFIEISFLCHTVHPLKVNNSAIFRNSPSCTIITSV